MSAAEFPARGPAGRAARGWILAGPALLLMAVVLVVPLAVAVHTSLYRTTFTGPDTFVGFDQYAALLTSTSWWSAVATTLVLATAIAGFQVILGFVVALTMRYAPRLRRTLALAVLIPFAVLPYAWTASWFAALDGGYLATWFGLDELGTPASLAAIVAAETWRGVGLAAVLCYVGLHRMSPRLLESARADGASLRLRLTRVMVPAAAPALAIAFGLRLLDTVRLFDPAVVARDYPGAEQPDVLGAAIFTAYAERGELGLASSAALLTVALTGIVALLVWLSGRLIARLRRRAVDRALT